MTTPPEAAALLDDVRALRGRARQDRHGYAFPLFLFGALILLAPLVYVPRDPREFGNLPVPVFGAGGDPLIRAFRADAGQPPAQPSLIAWYWFGTLVLGFLATAWWYRRRGARVGVETDTRGLLLAVGVAFAGFIAGAYAIGGVTESLYGAWAVNVPIILGGAALSAATLLVCRRPAASAPLRVAGLFVAAVFAAISFCALGVYAYYGFTALLVVAVGLLALAWLERSALLGVIGVVFAALSACSVFFIGRYIDPRLLLHFIGWDVADRQSEILQFLLLPAMTLLVGGAVAALTTPRKP